MQGVILTAGKGKRLQPFTLTRSKCMAPIVGKPMCALVIDSLIDAGVKDFVVVISSDNNEIEQYFISNYSKNTDLSFKFVIQPDRLGMAHAVECTKDFITEDFIVTAADSLVSSTTIRSLIDIFNEKNAMMALALLHVTPDKVTKMGIVELDSNGNVIKIVEKPKLEEAPSTIGSIPLYVFKPSVFNYLSKVPLSERGEYEIQDAIQMIINDSGSAPSVVADYRLDLTNVNDLLNINLKYLSELKDNIVLSKLPNSSKVDKHVYISGNVYIGENCIIGPNVFLEDNCRIEDGVNIKNSVVLRDSIVARNSVLDGQVVMVLE